MKTIFGNYIIKKDKVDKIMEFIASEDKEVIITGAKMFQQLFGIEGNIIRNSVYSLKIRDKITFTNKNRVEGKGVDYGKVISIGKENIVIEATKGTSSILKDTLENDHHFSILTQ